MEPEARGEPTGVKPSDEVEAQVGALEPLDIKSWPEVPAAVKRYEVASEYGMEPATPIVEVFVPPRAIGKIPDVIWLAEMAIDDVEADVIRP
jgi:hypothetical protein